MEDDMKRAGTMHLGARSLQISDEGTPALKWRPDSAETSATVSALPPTLHAYETLPRGVCLVVAVLLVAFAGPVHAADIFPYFKPDAVKSDGIKPDAVEVVQVAIAEWEPPREYTAAPAHQLATECAVDDRACLAKHDRNVLDLALLTASPSCCDQATNPTSCSAAYSLITGDTAPAPRWSGLDDPCTIVVRVDAGVATLYNPRTTQTRRVPDLGWRAGGYVGSCDVASLNLRTGASIESLPRFPWTSEIH